MRNTTSERMAKDAAATLTAKIKRLIVGFSLGGFVGFGLLAAGHHVGTTTQANASSARPTSAQFFGLSGGGSSPEKPQVTAPQPTEASPPPVSVSNVS